MPEQDKTREAASTFACPGCGGRAVFDPESQNLKCPYCGSESPIEKIIEQPKEYDIHDAPSESQKDWGVGVRVIRCQGCGAETVLEKNATAELCAFCGSPHVLDDQSEAGIAPESVIPFQITQAQAVSSFRKWLKKRWFAPSNAKRMATLGKITGVYLPHWTYDAETTSVYTGLAGHHYYVTVPVTVTRDGKQVTEMQQERRTSWTPTSGIVHNSFDDVLVAGSRRLEENLLSRVRPYDLQKLCRYQAGFLSGFLSEKPSVTLKEGWSAAQEQIDAAMRSLAREDILRRADEAQVSSLRSEHRNVRYKLTLLPMWLSSFTYKNKAYHVLINGQTGKAGGQAPVSPWRVLIAVLIGLALIGAAYMLLARGEGRAALRYISNF